MKNIQREDQSQYYSETISNNMYNSNFNKQSKHRRSLNLNATDSCSNDSITNEKTTSGDMIMIDAKDPDRPRFTLKELQKVLMEKNQLTVVLDQTKDELEQLRKQLAFYYFFLDYFFDV
jgi:hypothetical protein